VCSTVIMFMYTAVLHGTCKQELPCRFEGGEGGREKVSSILCQHQNSGVPIIVIACLAIAPIKECAMVACECLYNHKHDWVPS
jgi:hypothetical protein